MTNTESDTSLAFSRDVLILKLNQLLKNSEHEPVFAGNYQEIRIRYGAKTAVFNTRRAFGLMSLLLGWENEYEKELE